MSLNQLSNCPKCGKLFVKGVRDVCLECFKVEEKEYLKVIEFLRQVENRNATLYETSEATEVSIKQITKFIRQGRVSLKGLPNMGYPCESCGSITKEGNLCSECRQKFASSVKKMQKEVVRNKTEKQSDNEHGYQHIKFSKSKRNN